MFVWLSFVGSVCPCHVSIMLSASSHASPMRRLLLANVYSLILASGLDDEFLLGRMRRFMQHVRGHRIVLFPSTASTSSLQKVVCSLSYWLKGSIAS